MTEKIKFDIIVVDDDRMLLSYLKDFLNCHDMDVYTADCAYEAINVIKSRGFDLLLTDLQMPGMDGIELARKVRTMRPDMPIIMHTGNLLPEHYSLVERAVVSRVLDKTTSPMELLDIVRQCCSAAV